MTMLGNFRIFVQYTMILRQIYDNRTNTLNIVSITKYININIRTSLFASSREIIGNNLMDNDIIHTRRF